RRTVNAREMLAGYRQARRRRTAPACLCGHPREEAAGRMVYLQREVFARRQPLGSNEVRRGRAATVARLRGNEAARGEDATGGQVSPDSGPGATGASLGGDGAEGPGRRVAGKAQGRHARPKAGEGREEMTAVSRYNSVVVRRRGEKSL